MLEVFEAEGDVLGEDGQLKKERVELWKRNTVECVRELMGNAAFRGCIRYKPERQYADPEGKTRIYGNMMTANWWWDIQMLMPEEATISPVILASDKTTLSRMSGDKSAWPVYLTIGNIDKDVRRKPSAHATVLLGYLPVAKLECFSEKRRSLEGYRLFHKCMRALMEPLIEAGKTGVLMTCADGKVRRVYPILAAYIADHPEQALIAACQENYCPKCPVGPNKRGEPVFSCLKDPDRVSAVLRKVSEGVEKPSEFAEWGLRAVEPFWDGLPHANIFSALTPDILHQLHKGVFKDHLVSWATKAIEGGEDEIDRRFKAMFKHSDLRHFKNGISLVSQWTGTEYKAMEKVFLGVVAGAGDERVTRAVRAVLDFIYYAHFETHTDETLNGLHQSWLAYHKYKSVFVELKIREHFNFPKGHSTEHYEPSIRGVGTADGYSTEHPERLHIDFAKLAYGASNKQGSYIKQMTRWLERQEAVARFARYLEWALSPPTAPDTGTPLGSTVPSIARPTASNANAEEENNNDVGNDKEWSRGYRVAKTPAFPSIPISTIVADFGTTYFAWCLKDYLLKISRGDLTRMNHVADIELQDTTHVAVYKQCKVRLPAMRQVTTSPVVDIIHASPSHPGPSPLTTVPAYMSTVLARDPSIVSPTMPPYVFDHKKPLQGLRVARVRAIFDLPKVYKAQVLGVTDPLAYVEWFTPFNTVDSATGMYIVAPSTRQRERHVSVLPLTHIIRSCHLIPVWGKSIRNHTISGDILDNLQTKFYVNPYLRHQDFVLFRQLCNT
ncbi:hypothetical protein C8Q79DRAFT_1099175 [Trametes meyenii]|nr:hypothetical protein C8Q79DRAFT_1099175 [Trametes meyenii]